MKYSINQKFKFFLPKKIFLTVFLGGFCTLAFSQKTQRIDSLFSQLAQRNFFNGNVLLTEKGQTLYQKSFGYADIQNKRLNSDSSVFSLASVSKVFTSLAVLQLRDKGKLQLDDTFTTYFPDFPYAAITIRHLLSHTSGIPDYPVLFAADVKSNPNKVFTNQDIIPRLKTWNKPLVFKANEAWQYSNTNYCLLALLVEKLTKMSFQQYVHQFVFTPAQMKSTHFQLDWKHPSSKNRVSDQEYPFFFSNAVQKVDSAGKFRMRLYNYSGFVGQGNVMTTTIDMKRFDEALYTGKLLKNSTLKEALSPAIFHNGETPQTAMAGRKASYGLGWYVLADTTSGKIVGHTGGVPGALSLFVRNVSKKQTLILFDNAFNIGVYNAGFNALNLLNGRPVVPRKEPVTQIYGSTLVEQGVDEAFCILQKYLTDVVNYRLDEDEMNELGIQLLYENHEKLALEVLRMCTLLFPKSFNVYDSYGEALRKVGKKEAAIWMYQKSVELNPQNEAGIKALVEMRKEN